MLSTVHFFQTPQEIPGFFDSFFNGLFLVKGLPTFFQLGLLFTFCLSLASAVQFTKTQKSVWEKLSALGAFLSLSLAAFLLFQPWDELFIGLRHAQHLAEAGIFSFNRLAKIEGIVDFLPFFILGLLNKVGLPLVETNFLMEIISGWLCILAGRKILVEMKVENANVWSYPLLVLYPPLLLNTGNGFTVLMFTAFILWALIFLVFNLKGLRHWSFGCFILSLVPLIRLEGLWFTVLVFSFFLLKKNSLLSKRKTFLSLGLVLLPIIALTVWRITYFGRAIPTPIIYKSAIGNLFFTLMGFRNLLLDLVASGAGFFVCVIYLWRTQNKIESASFDIRRIHSVFCLLFIFSIPYYLSGGDWFPPAWCRYFFPFAFFCYIYGLGIITDTCSSLRRSSAFAPSLLLCFALAVLFFPAGGFLRLADGLLLARTSLSAIHHSKYGKGNYRIHYLSQLGNHLKSTTNSQTIIGSSELATVMFFSNREALDLLGVTNPDIAETPLRPNPALFSRVKTQNELPRLIFKRINPDLLYKKMPEIFYAFDFMLKDLLENNHPEEISESEISLALRRWDRRFKLLNDTLFGGLESLSMHGYEAVVVRHGLDFISLYFVSSDAREDHFARMARAGMVHSTIKNKHL